MGVIREFLKCILPPPVRTFLREIRALQKTIEQQTLLLEQGQKETLDTVKGIVAEQKAMQEMIQETIKQQHKIIEEQHQTILALLRSISEEQKWVKRTTENTYWKSKKGAQYASEAVWAEVFNNTISESTWMVNTAFSPGRWALGYPALYVMYRVLNEARPKRILELGLGQSTRMIAQYAAHFAGVEHIVVEHDPEWIAFFKNDFTLSERTEILQLDREMVPYQEAESVRVFKGFKEALKDQQFDFIFIDAPLGGDMKQYARIDVLGLMPDCLTENFIIMIDDTERSGEMHTVTQMENCLQENGITYKQGTYSGTKDCTLIAANNMAFFASI